MSRKELLKTRPEGILSDHNNAQVGISSTTARIQTYRIRCNYSATTIEASPSTGT